MMTTAAHYKQTWDLDAILPHPETDAFHEEFRQFETELRQLADRSDELPAVGPDASAVTQWASFLESLEALDKIRIDLNAFVECHAAADAGNKLFQQWEARLSNLSPLREKIATNIEFALKQPNEEDFEAFCTADDWLKQISFFLKIARRDATLRLPKQQELLAAELAVDGIHAWGRLYDRISGELQVQVMQRGEIVEKSPGQIQFDSPERSVRQNHFYAADKAWNSIADTCADALNHIAGTRLTIYRRLGLPDHLEVPLRCNRIQRETLSAMWSAVSDRSGMLLDYFSAKARLLGLERLTWYDLQAPLPQVQLAETTQLSYDQACDWVLQTFGAFSREFGDFARRAIEDRWIEAENRSGKRQGGFCTDLPTKKQSRIFMTFTGSPDSASTLAHELGHAYHAFVLRDQPLFLQNYPMNLAETASTFAEAVLGRERLRASRSAVQRLDILDKMLSDAVAFLMNIHARFIFEDRFHRERVAGELSPQRFSALMLDAQRQAYLDGLSEDGWYANFWISKLHFYISTLPFYNFPYTFGYLLSLGIFALAEKLGDGFADQYCRFLIATGCHETEQAVQTSFGYDLTDAAFWNMSLDVVEDRVKRFVHLASDV